MDHLFHIRSYKKATSLSVWQMILHSLHKINSAPPRYCFMYLQWIFKLWSIKYDNFSFKKIFGIKMMVIDHFFFLQTRNKENVWWYSHSMKAINKLIVYEELWLKACKLPEGVYILEQLSFHIFYIFKYEVNFIFLYWQTAVSEVIWS